ncbi:MAG: peptidylprolyl isomerase [Myxococcota bacterium]
MSILSAFVWAWVALGAVDEAVAEVGGVPIAASQVLRLAPDTPDAAALSIALRAAADEILLAREARGLMAADVAGLSDARAAAALLRRILDPAVACQRIPESVRRTRYDETRWRFVAPPAFEVDDVQLLCCSSPTSCKAPSAQACIDASAAESLAVREGLGRPTDAAGFELAFSLLSADHPRLARKQYRFYFDPDRPDAPMDARLQEVDRPIAQAVGAAGPGVVVGPVRSRFGYHFLWVRDRQPEIDLAWEDPRTQALLVAELCAPWLVARKERYLQDLGRTASLRVLRDAAARAFGAEAADALTAPPR